MNRSFKFALVLLCLLPLYFIPGCNGTAKTPRWIFFITLDTTRADHIDYSPGNKQTPNFAALAAQGCYFENAFSLIPITLPSHASMFYSLPPHRLKIYNNGQVPKIAEPSVTQLLKRNGYKTSAVISLGVLKSDFGLNKGFDRYIENFKSGLWIKDAQQVNSDTFNAVNTALKKNTGSSHFYWLHYSDPHEPYFPPHSREQGQLKISLDGQAVFSTPFTSQPSVDISVQVQPGKHELLLDSQVPPSFINRKDCPFQLQYIKYRDFNISIMQRKQPPSMPDSAVASIAMPAEWRSKKNKTGLDYYSKETKSRFIINNPRGHAVTVKISFIYSMQVDDQTRKIFYNEEVKYLDRQIGKLIAFLKEKKIYDDAVFVVMGDHGETLGDYRNHYGHIHYLNQSSMQVPLIIAGKPIQERLNKGSTPVKRIEAVSALNIAPTLLDIAGIKKSTYMLGDSLLKPIKAKKILLETYSPEAYFDAFSILDYPYQIVFYPGKAKEKLEFFNLENPAIVSPDTGQKRTELVNAVLKISRIITATKGKIGKTSKRHKEILKSLGYL